MSLVLSVDVGSASARAGLVRLPVNEVVAQHAVGIRINRGPGGRVEQSSADIWAAVAAAVRAVTGPLPDEDKARVAGIGFDATCSMVVTGADPRGVSVSDGDYGEPPPEGGAWDVVMWMDHRAQAQTQAVNATGHAVLDYVGGAVSPEMAIPKLKWLREHKSAAWWAGVAHVFELPDWLAHRATGTLTRSMCSTVCKWNYVNDVEPDRAGWDEGYLNAVGLSDVAPYIGTDVAQIGARVGFLTDAVKAEFGLGGCAQNIAVPTPLIDAHAGGLALVSEPSRVGVIAGTSACFMAVHPEKRMIPGVWGPYKDAMVPGLWLHEGGMSAFGALLDHIVRLHPAGAAAAEAAAAAGTDVHAYLTALVPDVLGRVVAQEVHVYPDFLGNRTPVGDATLRGMVSGLTIDGGVEDLAVLYCASVMSLAYGIRHVYDALAAGGYTHLETLVVCGGIARNPLFTRALAAVAAGRRVAVVPGGDAMLLGGAISAAVACGAFPDVAAAQAALSPPSHCVPLADVSEAERETHARRYRVFLAMLADQQKYRAIMRGV
eukprot:TRINITY_DN22788_c0_g1_i1.p1 TRINITY_DN22788_c0_g1~~TRINITY_DN22788_c0_g1_i1.p1  ORF type:complete len:545 (+),score=174.22 TRINITY_DN22788_c0_g1_i1:474-2108(+)